MAAQVVFGLDSFTGGGLFCCILLGSSSGSDQEIKHGLQQQLETADLEQVLQEVWASEDDS